MGWHRGIWQVVQMGCDTVAFSKRLKWAVTSWHLASSSKCFEDTMVLCNTMTTHPATGCHIPENLNPQQHNCKYFKYHTRVSVSHTEPNNRISASKGWAYCTSTCNATV
jgi:hypothetical protein